MDREPKYWFPAKRYGWGWGFPTTWQGWVVFLAFLVLSPLGALLLLDMGVGVFLAFEFGLAAALIIVCMRKGEPTRWRWGDD